MTLIQSHEVAERDGEFDIIRCVERIKAERLFQTHDDERETERVKTRIQQLKIVGQPSELTPLFERDPLEL